MGDKEKTLNNIFPLDKATLKTKSSRGSFAEIQFWENPFVKQAVYDLNAAEFPIFLFSPPGDGVCSYTYKDTINFKGMPLERSWEVVWTSKFGYPSASTQETFFVLLQMAREQGFPQCIDFGSVYELKKRMGKKNPDIHYKQTLRDLHCLTSIRIIATNSCWSSHERSYRPIVDYGLFDELSTEIPKEEGLDELVIQRHKRQRERKLPSVIKIGETFLTSLKENNPIYLSFEPDFFYSLSPVEQRIALLLSKYRRFSKNKGCSRNLMKLAEQIPLFAKKQKHLKSQLKRSLKSLQSKGLSFLKDFSFDTDGNKEEKIVFIFTEDKEKAVTEFIEKSLPLPTKTQPEPASNLPIKPVPKEESSLDLEMLHPSLRDLLLKYWMPLQEE